MPWRMCHLIHQILIALIQLNTLFSIALATHLSEIVEYQPLDFFVILNNTFNELLCLGGIVRIPRKVNIHLVVQLSIFRHQSAHILVMQLLNFRNFFRASTC